MLRNHDGPGNWRQAFMIILHMFRQRCLHSSPPHCLVTRQTAIHKTAILKPCLHPRYRLAGQTEACHIVPSSCLCQLENVYYLFVQSHVLCRYAPVIHQVLTCNSDNDVLRRAALTITLLDRRVLDVRGHIVLRSSSQNHCLLALGGRRLRTKCIRSRFWGRSWLIRWCNGSRGWWDLGQEVCRLCGRGCGGGRRCYGYRVGLLRLKVLRVSRSCHGNQCSTRHYFCG